MPTAKIELVDVTPAEKEESQQVFQEYLRELETLGGGDVPPGKTIKYPAWEQYWDGTPGYSAFWIVIGNGKVGFVFFRELTGGEWPTVPRPTQIAELCVLRPFRNREIGSTVMKFLIEDFRQRNELLLWDCLITNKRAEKMYDRVLAEFARGAGPDWTFEKSEFQSEAGQMWRYVCGPG
jgi:predicted acetyltransferase